MIKHSFDTETKGLDWFNEDEGPFLTTWSDQLGDDHLAHIDDKRAMSAFISDMRKTDLRVAHNLAFDVLQLRKHTGIDILKFGRAIDTALLGQVSVPERRFEPDPDAPDPTYAGAVGYGLDDLSSTYLPEEEQKLSLDELAKEHGIKLKSKGGYYKLWTVCPKEVEEYAMRDTRSTLGLVDPLAAKLDDRQFAAWDLECKIAPILINAQYHGVRVDQAKIEPLKATWAEKRDKAYDALVSQLGDGILADPTDPDAKDSSEDLADALLRLGVPLTETSEKTGKLLVNKNVLQEFESDFPIVKELFEYRRAKKFLATYIGPMDGRERVHPSYWQMGAWTSRMSCSRPNMQNIPVRGEGSAELREMFIPDPDYVWVISDFDSIEIRFLAYYLNNHGFRAMIEAGLDPHAWMASKIWGGEPHQYAKGGPNAHLRSIAKNVLFAIVYGAGGGRILIMLRDAGIPINTVHEKWYPGKEGYCKCQGCQLGYKIKKSLPGYWNLAGRNGRVQKKVRAVHHINTIIGRRTPVDPEKAYRGLSGLIQGSAAEALKLALIAAAEAVAPFGAIPLMFIHDEIGTLAPREYAEEVQRVQDQAMIEALILNPKLMVSSSIAEHNYAEGK